MKHLKVNKHQWFFPKLYVVFLIVPASTPEREADHSPPSRAEFKNAWSYTSTPQYVFMGWCLVKNTDNFTLPYLTSRSAAHLYICLFHFAVLRFSLEEHGFFLRPCYEAT